MKYTQFLRSESVVKFVQEQHKIHVGILPLESLENENFHSSQNW